MIEYESNSFKSKERKRLDQEQQDSRKREKVIDGIAKVKKKSGFSRLLESLMPEGITEAAIRVTEEIAIPALKDTILDGMRILLGVDGVGRTRSSYDVSFRRDYTRNNNRRTTTVQEIHSNMNFGNIIFTSRGEAERVLERLDELIVTYGFASVLDMYDAASVSCDFTWDRYGWSNIRNARVMNTRDGYLLKMPRAMPID